jgi:hypothetical protein
MIVAVTCAVLWAPALSQAATPGECVVHSSPSFVAQGIFAYAGSVADVVEVACAGEAGQPITLEDPKLYTQCASQLKWTQPVPYSTSSGASVEVMLDAFGNATAVMWSSGCAAGETHVRATLGVAPNTTAETSFTVFPPIEVPEGLEALPSRQVEGSEFSFATVVDAEFRHAGLKKAQVIASNLHHRCHVKPHLHWIYQGKERAGGKAVTLKLDANGGGFAVIIGGPSCAVGESLILAELIEAPYTQYTTSFLAEPPHEVL